ncbi:MAG: hypothetical protein ACLQVJ_13775 [Syntrophobacteraceae bacterium]
MDYIFVNKGRNVIRRRLIIAALIFGIVLLAGLSISIGSAFAVCLEKTLDSGPKALPELRKWEPRPFSLFQGGPKGHEELLIM